MERLGKVESSGKMGSLGVETGSSGLRNKAKSLSILLELWLLKIAFDWSMRFKKLLFLWKHL